MPSYSLASNVGVDGEPRLRGDDDVRRMVMVKMKMMGGGGHAMRYGSLELTLTLSLSQECSSKRQSGVSCRLAGSLLEAAKV